MMVLILDSYNKSMYFHLIIKNRTKMNKIKITITSVAILIGLVALTYGGFAFYSLELNPTKWIETSRFIAAMLIAVIALSILGSHTAMIGALGRVDEEAVAALESVVETIPLSIDLHTSPMNKEITIFLNQIISLMDIDGQSGTTIKTVDGKVIAVMETRGEIFALINKED